MGKESQLDVKGQITITERGHGLLFLDQLKKGYTKCKMSNLLEWQFASPYC